MKIKLRAWNHESKNWLDDPEEFTLETLRRLPVTIQLFTGFKDTNGKKIYDGDLIKGDGYGPYRIFWDEDIGGWCSCCYSDAELISRYNSIEIVGHVFDGRKYDGVQ